MTKTKDLMCCVAVLALMSLPTSAFAYSGEKLAANAKVTIDQARSIALKAHPGTITDEELEKEKGGSGLRYSFDIKSGGNAPPKSASTHKRAMFSKTAKRVRIPTSGSSNWKTG